MIIHCTSQQQIEDVIKTEKLNIHTSPEKIFKLYGMNSCIENGFYGGLDFYKSSGYTITSYSDWKERYRMKDIDVSIQVDVNTKNIKEVIESIKEFEKEVKLKDAITLLQSLGYKVEKPKPSDEEICETLRRENEKICYVADNHESKYYIGITKEGKYIVNSDWHGYRDIGIVYTTKEIAEKVCKELNG